MNGNGRKCHHMIHDSVPYIVCGIAGKTDSGFWCCRSLVLRRFGGCAVTGGERARRHRWGLHHPPPTSYHHPTIHYHGPTGSRLPDAGVWGGGEQPAGSESSRWGGWRKQTWVKNVGGGVIGKIPTCKPPCRSVLTVVLTSEARLYRYLTCGGQSSNWWRISKSPGFLHLWKSLKVSGSETQDRLGWVAALISPSSESKIFLTQRDISIGSRDCFWDISTQAVKTVWLWLGAAPIWLGEPVSSCQKTSNRCKIYANTSTGQDWKWLRRREKKSGQDAKLLPRSTVDRPRTKDKAGQPDGSYTYLQFTQPDVLILI